MKKVSIIVPVYNEEKYLDKCLDSLLKQTYKNIEIIVVDDGSCDNSAEIAREFPVTYLFQDHQGAAMARNLGAKKAKGEILAFADADMVFDNNYIRSMVDPILQKKAIGTFSKINYVANPENVWSQCYNINLNLNIHLRTSPDHPNESPIYSTMLKKVFEKVEGFDNIGYGEDIIFSQKLQAKSKAAPGAIYYHYNPDSLQDVFITGRWLGRGNRFKFLPSLIRLVKYSMPFSLAIGTFKSIKYLKPQFLIFKIVWDAGVSIGIINQITGKSHAK